MRCWRAPGICESARGGGILSDDTVASRPPPPSERRTKREDCSKRGLLVRSCPAVMIQPGEQASRQTLPWSTPRRSSRNNARDQARSRKLLSPPIPLSPDLELFYLFPYLSKLRSLPNLTAVSDTLNSD